MIIKLKLVLWSWLWAYRINKIRSLSKKHIKKKKELSPHFRSSLVLKYTKSLLKLYNVKVEIKGYENLQKTPAMVVANHASNADSLIIYSALEKQNKDEQDKENVLTFLAKKELENKKVTKWILQLIDTFFIDRKKIKESFTTLVDFGKFVRDKKTYGVVFPEGTRTEDGHIQNFKIGAFKIAKKQFLPIIPITINNSGRVFDSNRKEKLVVEVIIHKPIKAPFVASQPAEALALKAKNIIEQFMEETFKLEKHGIEVTAKGSKKIVSVKIKDSILLDPDDAETLEDLLSLVINELFDTIDEEQEKLMPAMPGLGGLGF